MPKKAIQTLMVLLSFVLITLPSLQAVEKGRDMNNITLVPHAENIFLFYRCGDALYFNYDIKKLRRERDGSVSFNWYTNQTMIGFMYCDGFGFPLINEKVAAKDIEVTILPNQMDVFYSPLSNKNLVKKVSYKRIPGDMPRTQDWTAAELLKSNDGREILADSYQAFEFNGRSYLLYSYMGKLAILTPEKKALQFDLDVNIDRHAPIKGAVSLSKGKATLYALLPTGDKFTWFKLDLMGLHKGIIRQFSDPVKFFPSPTELSSYELKAPLNGKVVVYYIPLHQGIKSKAEFDVDNAYPKLFSDHKGFVRPFDPTKEDKCFDLFQMPLNCHQDRDCMLVDFSYPKSASFFANPSALLHATYGGKVVAVPLNTLPTKQEKMELIGIIEGPPPVPLANVMSSLKGSSGNAMMDGARDLSRWIFTQVDQSMTFTLGRGNTSIKTTTHMVQAGANIPTAVPITLSAMGQFSSKLMREDFVETTGTIKKTFVNEIQHVLGVNKRLQMRPIGKLIFLKYDLKAYRYVFKDEHDKVLADGPQLFSITKTNYRPIVRPYEIIAKQVNPGKYPHHFVVGDMASYASLHRRRTLLDKASILSPGHNYLSYTYNNLLDLSTQFEMTATNRITREDTETVTAELGGGIGSEETPISLNFSIKNEEERIYTLVNQKSQGMAISAEIGMPLLAQDPKVKSYDFEIYYLAPENHIATDLIEELKDTRSKSHMNKKLSEMIIPTSKPWKVTYSVSEIRDAIATPGVGNRRSTKYIDTIPNPDQESENGEGEPIIRWNF
ncbi:MAG: hypothetical protein HYV97_18170 [Bdellovibrio sp.]|nr:hypothetical protein [Bdellovibrio sp.]